MTETGAGGPAGPNPDEAGEEAHRLFSAVQQWAQRAMPAPPSGHPGPECQWCPLCQLAAVLRGEYPELGERITEAGAAVAGAVRALLESGGAAPPDGQAAAPPEDAPAAEQRRPSPRQPRVQHIHLDDSSGGTAPSDPKQEG